MNLDMPLTIDAVAKLTGIPTSTIRSYCFNVELPATKLGAAWTITFPYACSLIVAPFIAICIDLFISGSSDPSVLFLDNAYLAVSGPSLPEYPDAIIVWTLSNLSQVSAGMPLHHLTKPQKNRIARRIAVQLVIDGLLPFPSLNFFSDRE